MRKGARLIRPTWLALSVVACMALQACGSKTTSGQDKISIVVVYAVEFPGGEEGLAKIAYSLPDGTTKDQRVRVPWRSEQLIFKRGDSLMLEATAMGSNKLTQLECKAISDPQNPSGTTYGYSGVGKSRARGKAGGQLSLPG